MMSRGKRLSSRVSPEELARSGVVVRIPSALRSFTEGQDEILLEAADVASLLARLDASFPGIRDRVVDETGRRREFVNIFVNDELVRGPLDRIGLRAGDTVHILPSVAGGSDG